MSSKTLLTTLEVGLHDLLGELDRGDYRYIHLSDPNNVMGQKSLLSTAHRNRMVKDYVVSLAKKGFHVYHAVDGVSRFVREDHIPQMWHAVRNGDYQASSEGVIYRLDPPRSGGNARNLIVVFSSIGGDIFGNGLSRYFTQNFRSIQKHVPADTAILRIADVGGVVGSFYLDTAYCPNNSKRIHELIEEVRLDMLLPKGAIITYGASKGATGALYYALRFGYRSVCVEPIVNDAYYESEYGDSHFTRDGVFINSKEDTFTDAMEQHRTMVENGSSFSTGRIVVVYSDQSPQAPYIRDILGSRVVSDMSLVNFRHPSIKDHPDVSPNSLNLVSMYLNMMCYGFPVNGGHFGLRCVSP